MASRMEEEEEEREREGGRHCNIILISPLSSLLSLLLPPPSSSSPSFFLLFSLLFLTPQSPPPSLSPSLQLTCATVGLPVDCDSSSCLWVCCSDGYGGQVCLLDLQPSTQPHLVTNITISDSKILCIAAVPVSTHDDTPLAEVATEIVTRNTSCSTVEKEGEEEVHSTDSSISDTSSEVSHTSVSRTGSSASEYKCSREEALLAKEGGNSSPLLSARQMSKHEDEEEEEEEDGDDGDIFHSVSEPKESLESSLGCVNGITGTANSTGRNEQGLVLPFERQSRTVAPTHLPKGVLRRVRSNSAPPDPERTLTNGIHPSILNGSHQKTTSSTVRKIWAPLTLRPGSTATGDVSVGRSMWLGTEGGNLYVYSTGNNLRSRTNRQTVDLPAAVHCIRSEIIF